MISHVRSFLPLAIVAVGLFAPSARADLMAVGTGLTLSWDRGLNPSGSGFMTIPILNTNTSDPRELSAWSLAVRVVPEGGATGVLSINVATIAYPANEVISTPSPSGAPVSNNTFSGHQAGDVIVSASNANIISGQDAVPASGANLFQLQFTGSLALGTFDLYAFNRTNGFASYWTDQNGNSVQWAGMSAGAISTNQVLIGTITVTATPEPGSLALAGVAATALGFSRYRRRQRQDASPSSA